MKPPDWLMCRHDLGNEGSRIQEYQQGRIQAFAKPRGVHRDGHVREELVRSQQVRIEGDHRPGQDSRVCAAAGSNLCLVANIVFIIHIATVEPENHPEDQLPTLCHLRQSTDEH